MRRLFLLPRPLLCLYTPPRPAVLSFPPAVHRLPTRTFSTTTTLCAPTELSPESYNAIANATLDSFFDACEAEAEERPEVDVEYSAGVLTLTVPHGTYVLNKQPPNKQIWLSSPVSGPKRYDWDADRRNWVYARDGSGLEELLKEEIGVSFDVGDVA
ncbi:arabinogalactan endo-1,4-beta-galactosidase [Geopyxis carbonaria]|nr:arabinogalactan endo-1,4-beta-galactosidase [Geopyxis carbonaria]